MEPEIHGGRDDILVVFDFPWLVQSSVGAQLCCSFRNQYKEKERAELLSVALYRGGDQRE